MSELTIDQLAAAIEDKHGGRVKFVEAISARKKSQGRVTWEGTVHVFDIEGHPGAKRAYAWSSLIQGSDSHRVFTVLGIPPINSAKDALRAAVVEEKGD